jgi:hypothetical protein
MLLVFILPVWIAWTANGSPMDHVSLSLLVSASLSGILAFIKEILGGKPLETTTSTTSTPTSPGRTMILMRSFASKFKFFLSDFAHDTSARAPRKRKYYDPDPRRRRHSRGHRKGVEPAGLKRWRLAHRRTHDPGYQRSLWRSPRGGHYFRGPRKNRYDPAAPRRRRFSGARRVGGKLGGIFSRYGTAIGALIGGGIGAYIAYNDYQKAYGASAAKNYLNTIIGGDMMASDGTTKLGTRTPEISHLWGTNDTFWDKFAGVTLGPVDFVKYKFLGLQPDGTYKGSAWVYPFWIGLVATLAAPVARLFTSKGQRFLRPLHKVGVGMLAVSTVGALALPGCPKPDTVNMVKTPNGSYAQNPMNNLKIEGAF